MSLSKELEKAKYDKRLLDWNVSRGKLTKEEVKAYLDGLPDLASNVEALGLATGADVLGLADVTDDSESEAES